jgi:hypothetical protein
MGDGKWLMGEGKKHSPKFLKWSFGVMEKWKYEVCSDEIFVI